MNHYKIEKTEDITGLSLSAGRNGEKVIVAVKGFVTSNDKIFFTGISDIHTIFLQQFIQQEACNQFLILRHEDKSADIYVNDFTLIIRCISKGNIIGKLVKKSDIADIKSLEFGDITIAKTDAILLCMRVGWKFGLYFNFTANPGKNELNLTQINRELGWSYRSMVFEDEYRLITDNIVYPRMLADGWFPFIDLVGTDYQELSKLYVYEWLDKIEDFLNKFDKCRIDKIIEGWWSKKQFQDKRALIEAGISAFLQNDNSGNINCIHTLYPQIEGIMGLEFFKEHGRKPSFKELKEYIRNRAHNNFSSDGSLGFPEEFYQFMDKNFFQEFDLSQGKTDLARHSSAHGYAKQQDFTRVKALQAILILDQLFFYI